MKQPKVYSYFDRPVDPGISFAQIGEEGWSGAQQSAKQECDINHILKGYAEKGIRLEDLIQRDPSYYGDFSDTPDFHAAQEILARTSEQFASLDAKVRERFNNDPGKFLQFLDDARTKPRLAEEALELGLLKVVEASKRVAPPVASDKLSGEPAAPVFKPVGGRSDA